MTGDDRRDDDHEDDRDGAAQAESTGEPAAGPDEAGEAGPGVEWDEAWDEDVALGLTPRAWLDSDPVPLTPDVDVTDPAQRLAWIQANNEVRAAREVELERRRERLARGETSSRAGGGGGTGRSGAAGRRSTVKSTTIVVGVRLLREERRILTRIAREEALTVSDLVRRWVREQIAVRNDVGEPADRAQLRQEVLDSADATVARITDELRRLREIVVATG